MANTLEILIQARDDASPALKNVATSAKQMGDAIDNASKKIEGAGTRASKFEQTAGKIDSAGRNARIGLSSMAQAAQLLGVDIGGVVGPASQAADAIGDITGAVGELGLAAGAIGLVIAAIGAAKVAIDAYNKSIAENILYQDQYLQNAYIIVAQNNALAGSFEKLKAATIATQEISFQNLLEQSNAFQGMQVTLQLLGVHVETLASKLQAAKASFEAAAWGAQSGYDALEHMRGSMENLIVVTNAATEAAAQHATQLQYEAAAALRAAAAMGDTRGEAIKDFREGASSVAEMNTKAWLATHEFQQGAGWVEKIGTNAATTSTSISQMVSKLKSLVEGALSPTSVQQRMGMASDAWDEFRLRLDAVATGTDPSKYGAEFVKMFNDLGMSAEQAAKAFQDFSLFADPKNIKLVNMQPIIDSVKNSLDQMIGKANLTSAAMKEVWKNLTPQQKAALGAQGINSVEDAVANLIDPTKQAKNQAEGLQQALNAIPKTITTIFNVVKDAAEQAIQDFQQVLDDFIAKYSSVTISISAETNATPPAPGTVPSPGPQVPQFAEGGMMWQTGYAYLHAGERVLTRSETAQYNNHYNNNYGGITVVLPGVQNVDDFISQLNRKLGRTATMRSAMGI